MILAILIYAVIIFIVVLTTLKIYFKQSIGWCRSQQCLVGKTAIVTGANTGIGYETAVDFAKRGAKVILACRDPSKAEAARINIINETGNPKIIVKLINLSSYESVREFAKEINETESRLDILVNNAGVVAVSGTRNGHVELMKINHFSAFLLTNLLGNLLKKSGPSRIINVSSLLARYAQLDADNLNKGKSAPLMNYNISKACNILFTRELARRLNNSNSKVTTFSVHPGAVNTAIFETLFNSFKSLFYRVVCFFFRTALEGAQTIIYTSVTQGIERYNGQHFQDCTKQEPFKIVGDGALGMKVWEKSVEEVKLQPTECQF